LNYNLNIITLDIPYPPDYGGMIDTYYRIQSLNDLGIHIHLHSFEYGRPHSKELESLCETIRYYPRKTGFSSHFSIKPYIVSSRKSGILLENLIRNDFPILFDGLHTTYYINHPSLSDRRKFIRVHNIEHRYYDNLAKHESDLTKKFFFKVESVRLKWYEKVLDRINCLFPISNSDQKYFSEKYHNSKLITPFHQFKNVECMTGSGDYLLYHGDLSVNENAIIVNSLIDNVFSKVPFKCIIAGKNPPKQLLVKVSGHSNIDIVANPENKEMTQLVCNAQINILPALEMNGYKIKLLFALFAGRHCIVNSKMISGNDLGSLCHVADSDVETIKLILQLMQEEFSANMIEKRRKLLLENYSNQINSKKLIDLIFNQPSPFL
jgi:hypothetical protein